MRALTLALASLVVACGPVPSTADAGNPALLCDADAMEVTLAGSVQAQIFDNPCKSCHNASDASRGDFSEASKTAAGAVNVDSLVLPGVKRVEPGNLARSVMWLKLNGLRGPNGERVGGVMPPSGMLPPEKRKIIKDWICTGAK